MLDGGPPRAGEIAYKELSLLLGLAKQAGVDDVRLQHDLRLSPDDWQQWLGVLRDAPLPSHPALPLMLRHLGFVASRLDRKARHSDA